MKFVLIIVFMASVASPSLAQTSTISSVPSLAARIEAMPKDLPRAEGPSLQVALELALAAVEACKAKGGNVSVLITDSTGVPIVLLSGDGTGERSQLITHTKAYTVIKYGMASGDVKRRARADPALAREVSLDPNIGEARLGAFPLMKGGTLIGALSVSGLAAGGNEDCAQAAIAKVPLR